MELVCLAVEDFVGHIRMHTTSSKPILLFNISIRTHPKPLPALIILFFPLKIEIIFASHVIINHFPDVTCVERSIFKCLGMV